MRLSYNLYGAAGRQADRWERMIVARSLAHLRRKINQGYRLYA